MTKNHISFTSNIDEINAHLEKLYEKIEVQIQLHKAFITQQKEIQYSGKNHDSVEKNDSKSEFSAS